ncbi:MAG: TIGR03936 family radical SAM-associated protein, partial [Nannocystaceae bacterium]
LAYRSGARFDGWKEAFSFDRWLQALEDAGIEPARYTRTIPVDARLPWDHFDIGLDPDFLAGEWRKAVKGRVSPPCGKPAGAQVHHKTVEEAIAERRRLVCYDCGIACDMSEMRIERLDSLRELDAVHTQREAAEAAQASAAADVIPAARLTSHLQSLAGFSKLDEDSAFKEAAEAAFTRVRVHFAKRGAMRYMGHLDLLRVIPRMLRRARLEVAFSRGFNPIPRMSFGPALPLGTAAQAEVVDLDLLLEGSAAAMAGEWSDTQRDEVAAELRARLEVVTPPGLEIVAVRVLAPGERRLGELIAAADYAVALDEVQTAALATALPEKLAAESLPVTRMSRKKRKRKRARGGGKGRGAAPPKPEVQVLDARPRIIDAAVDVEQQLLRLRLRMGQEGGARPREVVEALVGEKISDHRFCRERLLVADEERFVPTCGLAPELRLRPPPPVVAKAEVEVEAPSPTA